MSILAPCILCWQAFLGSFLIGDDFQSRYTAEEIFDPAVIELSSAPIGISAVRRELGKRLDRDADLDQIAIQNAWEYANIGFIMDRRGPDSARQMWPGYKLQVGWLIIYLGEKGNCDAIPALRALHWVYGNMMFPESVFFESERDAEIERIVRTDFDSLFAEATLLRGRKTVANRVLAAIDMIRKRCDCPATE